MDWFYYIAGKVFIWGLFIIIIGGIGYFLGFNHSRLPILKDFAIVRTEALASPTPKVVIRTKTVEDISETPTATPSSIKKSPTPRQ